MYYPTKLEHEIKLAQRETKITNCTKGWINQFAWCKKVNRATFYIGAGINNVNYSGSKIESTVGVFF